MNFRIPGDAATRLAERPTIRSATLEASAVEGTVGVPRTVKKPPPASAPPSLGDCATSLKALGDPTRLEIVSMVAASAVPLCACEIEAHFDLAQSTISHHLGLLRRAGILDVERRGTWNFYAITPHATTALTAVVKLLNP